MMITLDPPTGLIHIERSSYASATINPSGFNNDIAWNANISGLAGNDIKVIYQDPQLPGILLNINFSDNTLYVTLGTDGEGSITTTGSDLITAVEEDETISALFTLAPAPTANGFLAGTNLISLSGGTDFEEVYIGQAGIFTDSGLPGYTFHDYRARSKNESGYSDYSQTKKSPIIGVGG